MVIVGVSYRRTANLLLQVTFQCVASQRNVTEPPVIGGQEEHITQ